MAEVLRARGRARSAHPGSTRTGANMIRKFDKAGSARWASVAALLALVLLPSFAGAQSTQDKHRAQREQSLFNLAAGPSSVLQINQYQCGLVNTGDTCTDV